MSKKRKKLADGTLALNRKARYLYHVDETLECGIALQGTEVKSMKANQFAFSDAHGQVKDGQLTLVGLHISPYSQGNIHNHDPDRPRKLLAHGQQIAKLHKRVTERGSTLIPLRFYVKRGLVKLELGLCRGKKLHDKRDDIRRRDQHRDALREMSLDQRP